MLYYAEVWGVYNVQVVVWLYEGLGLYKGNTIYCWKLLNIEDHILQGKDEFIEYWDKFILRPDDHI